MLKDLSQGKVSKQIFFFALPMLLGNIFQQLYNVVDIAVVGKYLGDNALAAVGASFPVIFLLISLGFGVSMGGTITVSHFFGAKQYDKVRRTVDTMNIFISIFSIVFAIIGIVFSDRIFALIKLPDDIIPLASSYLKVYLYGLPFFFGFGNISAILRGVGDSKTPLFLLAFASMLNIALDFLFVGYFKWGISSVAWATIISQGLAFISAIIYLRKNKLLRFHIKGIVFDYGIFKKSIKIGLPSGIQHILFSLGMMALFSIVNKFGVKVIAAYSSALRLDSLAIMPSINLASALSTFVGQNLGAGRYDRIKKGLLTTIGMSFSISITISIIFYFFGENLMTLFSNDPEVIKYGKEYLVIVSSFYVMFSALFSLNAVMRGAGDVIIPMFITLIALWMVRVPFAYFLSDIWGETAVWWSAPVGWSIGIILSFSYYRTNRWKRKFKI
jgi:putative MATE family efflux protein